MTDHNHLDRQRRQPGDCPRCDELWEEQRQRLRGLTGPTKAERQIEELVRREGKLGEDRYGHKPGA